MTRTDSCAELTAPKSPVVVEKRSIRDDESLVHHPPLDRLTVVAVLSGLCHVEHRGAPARDGSTLAAGDTSRLIGRGPAVRLRRSPSGKQCAEVAFVALSLADFRRYADEHPEVAVPDPSALETPRIFDPVVAAVATDLLGARAAGTDEHYVSRAAGYLVAHLLRPDSGRRENSPGLSPGQLLTVTTYMRQNLSSPITLEDLAQVVPLSRYHFARQFRAATGRTPVQYLTELRVDTACRLLTTSNELISVVGSYCGFASPENFARVFRKQLGCSPLQYRQRSFPV